MARPARIYQKLSRGALGPMLLHLLKCHIHLKHENHPGTWPHFSSRIVLQDLPSPSKTTTKFPGRDLTSHRKTAPVAYLRYHPADSGRVDMVSRAVISLFILTALMTRVPLISAQGYEGRDKEKMVGLLKSLFEMQEAKRVPSNQRMDTAARAFPIAPSSVPEHRSLSSQQASLERASASLDRKSVDSLKRSIRTLSSPEAPLVHPAPPKVHRIGAQPRARSQPDAVGLLKVSGLSVRVQDQLGEAFDAASSLSDPEPRTFKYIKELRKEFVSDEA